MATLILTKVWINRLGTGEAVSAYSAVERDRGHDVDGDVRTFAGGRQRAITQAGERGRFSFALRDVPLSTVDKLRSWIGLAVQVRDHRGQRFFGVFLGVGINEIRGPENRYDLAISLRTITAVEGV